MPDVEPAKFFACGDEGEFEELEELKKVKTWVARPLRSNDRNIKRRTTLRTKSGVRSVLRLVAWEHSTGTDKKKGQVDREERGPRVFLDFHFMGTTGGSVPILTLNFLRPRWIAATIFPSEGATGSVRSFSARFIEKVGVQRFISFSDNELAMCH